MQTRLKISSVLEPQILSGLKIPVKTEKAACAKGAMNAPIKYLRFLNMIDKNNKARPSEARAAGINPHHSLPCIKACTMGIFLGISLTK
jgi:hypothetical protein